MLIQERMGRACRGVGGGPTASLRIAVIIALSSAAAIVAQGIRIGPWPAGEAEQTTASGVYLPNDRALSRAMTRARERLADGEYQQSLTFLHQVLSREEDSFLDESPDAAARSGVKATARRMIGELPPEGRDAFELLYGAAARRQLDTAVDAGDRSGVAQVVRQSFHTQAGYEATLVLAQMESDAGHHLAAAQLYQELLDSPRAAAALEPQLSMLSAVNLLAAGRESDAVATLKALIERMPSASLELAGSSLPVPGSQGDLLAWLTEHIGKVERRAPVERDWMTLHGNASRNAQHAGGAPHLRARWQARVVNDPNIEEFLTGRARQFAEREEVLISAARPIVVGDVVLMRTPSNVVAVDWQTGKRVWETREEEGYSADELLPMISAVEQSPDGSISASVLEQRLWDDALAMSLSSDGQRAYVIRGAGGSPEEAELEARLRILGGIPAATTRTTNALAAFDLATEGKLAWELDGGRPGPLAGAFFLGGPLSIDNTLFVFAEIRFAIYLVAIDPNNGVPQWQQQLVGLEQGIAADARRRMAGSSPSYAGGYLICPTAAGATIAVDIVRRELAWVYEYSRNAMSRAELQLMLQQQMQRQLTRDNNRWFDSAAMIDEGRVFLTPPESQELHCVDLRTGAELWKHRQGDALFIGCVDLGNVLLVGSRNVEALRASDGARAWQERSLALPEGTRPAGQGYLSEGQYHLPLTNGSVIAIDVANGKQVGIAAGEAGARLGNLICTRGSVFSQSHLVLDKFEQLEAVQTRAEAALAKNGDDATALRELAEMKRVAGEAGEAIELLKRAHQLAPADPLVREALAENLLAALEDDYRQSRGELPLLRSLISGRQEELELLRIEARGLEGDGERLAAWDAYLRAADAETGIWTDIELSPDHVVRSDRWIGGRLAALWSAASADERLNMSTRIRSRSATLSANAGIDALREFLTRFGRLPGTDERRLQLANHLVTSQQLEAAELELLTLMTSDAPETLATATALLAKVQIDSGKIDAAVALAKQLLREWPTIPTVDGLFAKQFVERLAAESPAFGQRLLRDWPRGHVRAESDSTPGPTLPQVAGGRPQRQLVHRQLRIEQDYAAGFAAEKWFLSSEGSQLVGRQGDGLEFATLPVEPGGRGRRASDVDNAHAARLGNLLFVSLSGRIFAIDSRQVAGTEQALWEAYSLGRYAAMPSRSARGRGGRAIVYDSSRTARKRDVNAPVNSALGPATPQGVVFFEQDDLKCVDPLSGDTLWSRRDIPRTCELFGDDEIVVAVNALDRSVQIIQKADGALVGRREISNLPWLLIAGRNSVSTTRRGDTLQVTVTDVVSGDALFDADYAAETCVSEVAPHLAAIYEPTGKFQLLDARNGKLLIDRQLKAHARAQRVLGFISDDVLIIAITSEVRVGPDQSVSADYRLVDGLVYAFDLASGEPLWPGPAVVHERGLAMAGPADSPFVMFADKETRRDTGSGPLRLRLLAIDKWTGQSVYRNDELPNVPNGQPFEIRLESATDRAVDKDVRSVVVDMNTRQLRLTPTDKPRPPEPPAHDELAATREITARGLRAAMQRATEALEASKQENQPQPNRAGRARRGR